MKVVLICTSDSGGAGLCCQRICNALNSIGVECKMLVLYKKTSNKNIVQVGRVKNLFWRMFNKLLRICGLEITEFNYLFNLCHSTGNFYSSPYSIINISKHPLIRNADIVHLHWINGMIDFRTFFGNINKPIIWTLHDENLFYGMAHYESTVIKDNKKEQIYYTDKKNGIAKAKKLGIVFLSNMMYNKYNKHEIIINATKTIINNSVDTNIFTPHDKNIGRKKYGISSTDIVFIFVSATLTDKRKGLSILQEAIKSFNNPQMKILAIGNPDRLQPDKSTIFAGSLHDGKELSIAYSCGNYFVMPSIQEAFAQAPLEAMACGIPAIVSPVSGTEELITPFNGIICDGFTVNDFVNGISSALSTSYDGNIIRKDIIERFSPEVMARKYTDFYKKNLSN